MTKARDFKRTTHGALCTIILKSTIADYELMEMLNFSPPSWKTWKPLLRQKLTTGIQNYGDEGEMEHYRITYDKKQKTWSATLQNNTQ